MCTVVFIPGKERNYFASLRDESPLRPKAKMPTLLGKEAIKYLAPVDSLAGGTWIGTNELGVVIILLNGGFENHERKMPYAKSRGLIVTDLLQSAAPVVDWSKMNMDNVEPYTLIVWVDGMLFQLVWDGQNKHRIMLKIDKPHIWSSATLYDAAAKARREAQFKQWIAPNPTVSKESLFNFFKSFQDSVNGFLINRNRKLQTLSYTFIETRLAGKTIVNYYDLQTSCYHTFGINLKSNSSDHSLLFHLTNEN